MGIGPFRSSYTRTWEPPPPPPNPNPSRFKIVKTFHTHDLVVLEVRYPDATNFEGRKILVLRDPWFRSSRVSRLDPHFSKQSKLLARFRPTKEGWKMACSFAVAVANQ